jgi:hypothetical protein
MTNDYASFKTFNDKETAEDFSEVLKTHSIEFFIEEDVLEFDASYANNALDKDYHIMIRQQDFKKATKAYEEYFKSRLHNAPPDYYLFTFTDNELKDILAKPDEWGIFDYLLAEKILHDRGFSFSEEEKEILKTTRHKELQEQQKEKPYNIVVYYFFCLLFFPIGIFIGWAWGYSKKTLPDGQRSPAYDAATQRHGRIIFSIAVLLFVLTVLWKVTGPRK